VSVRAVESAADLRKFVGLPYRLHARDPLWAPPLRLDVRARLSPRRNPFFDHGEARYFLAERDGRVVGRIAAIANHLHDEAHGDGAAFFGFFDCADDPAAARALFDEAGAWARTRGYSTLRGPVSFSTNDECGLLVDGFDTPPTMLMAHNPPYYVGLVENAGFRKAKDLWAFQTRDLEHAGHVEPRAVRAAERLRARQGVEVRPLERRRFWDDVERLRESYNAMWERNWGFVPMTGREILHMAGQLKPFYLPGLVPFVEKAGRVVGFGLAMPDLNVVLRRHRSGRLLPALPFLLRAARKRPLGRVRVLLLGVLPEFRGKGIDALLWHWIWARCAEYGVTWGEASWILEDNAAMANATERMGFVRYKTLRLYDRPT